MKASQSPRCSSKKPRRLGFLSFPHALLPTHPQVLLTQPSWSACFVSLVTLDPSRRCQAPHPGPSSTPQSVVFLKPIVLGPESPSGTLSAHLCPRRPLPTPQAQWPFSPAKKLDWLPLPCLCLECSCFFLFHGPHHPGLVSREAFANHPSESRSPSLSLPTIRPAGPPSQPWRVSPRRTGLP